MRKILWAFFWYQNLRRFEKIWSNRPGSFKGVRLDQEIVPHFTRRKYSEISFVQRKHHSWNIDATGLYSMKIENLGMRRKLIFLLITVVTFEVRAQEWTNKMANFHKSVVTTPKYSIIWYNCSWAGGCFMKNIRFDIFCDVNQEPQDPQRHNCACGFIGKSAVIKYHRLLSKGEIINGK